MRNDKPLINALNDFIKHQPSSLHVPGHKNGLLSNLPQAIQSALPYDVTELTGLDDLHHPEEAIKEAEQLLAETYNSSSSFFLVNGSTVGNLAMIYATCRKGDMIIVQRNAHKSIFHAIDLVEANPIFISPEWDDVSKTATHVSLDTLKEALAKAPNAKAVVLTTPTYYGVINHNLNEQISLCHSKCIPVLIDEAHGAHFAASNHFPESALDLGADVVVQSAHKTLPAMTMGSFLHVNSTLVDVMVVKRYLQMLQSSSPSYLIMASLDDARHYVSTYIESDYRAFKEKRESFITWLRLIQGVEVIEVDDPLKLLVRVKGYTGFELKEALEQEQVFVELADLEQVLFILPLLKATNSYPFPVIRSKVKEAVEKLRKKPKPHLGQLLMEIGIEKVTTPIYTFEEIRQLETEWIPYTKAIGRISTQLLIPYPPGIPLFIPGEKITLNKLAYLTELLAYGAEIQGHHQLEEKLIQVVKVGG